MMDKTEIIKYYEGIIDKCHEVIIQKREIIRQYKENKLSLQFHINRTQRANIELMNQQEQLKRDFSGRL